MSWSIVEIGEYRGKGKTLPQIVLENADWFFRCFDTGQFKGKGELEIEAEEINRKARSIRIPQGQDEDLVAEYLIHPPTRRFWSVEVVSRSQPPRKNSIPWTRRDVFDLHVPRDIAPCDKKGCGLLMSILKCYLFGRKNVRLTKKRCEQFFCDDRNFVL